MSGAPRVTVVIPCFNLGSYLDEAVQSVLEQTFEDFEILVIDDGSTDEATRFLFASYRRPKTRLLRTANRGLAATRNLGAREARGGYICFLDADDLLEPTFLERTVATLDADPGLAFASCWLRGFGALEFDWRPESCDFPRLLVECTFCTASLLRRDRLLEVGGFDAGMPVAGYEDWDLALTLVERGLRGAVVRELLFRYRIRSGSMSATCTAPENHALLFAYLIDKHPTSYRRELGGALAAIEARIAELERHPALRAAAPTNPAAAAELRSAFLERSLRSMVSSRIWDGSRWLRRIEKARFRFRSPRPEISVVVPAGTSGHALSVTLESLFREGSRTEILVVDRGDGGQEASDVVEAAEAAGAFRVAAPNLPGAAALRIGFEAARGDLVTALAPGETVRPGTFAAVISSLAADPGAEFAIAGVREARSRFVWQPRGADLADLLGSARLPFPILRRSLIARLGASFREPDGANLTAFELAVGAARIARGLRVDTAIDAPEPDPAAIRAASLSVLERHVAELEGSWRGILLARDRQRSELEAVVQELASGGQQPAAEPARLDFGSFGGTDPVSRVWGLDRGQPIDRYFIERFLDRHRAAITGRVLEVKDAAYTRQFGSLVSGSDVVDIAPENDEATMIADLASVGSLPTEAFDCILLTQTVHVIYDVPSVLENVHRALKPGGVLLVTLPAVSRLDYESGLDGDFWRFTPASARRLVAERFGEGRVRVEAAGNVLVCTAFLQGLAVSDLSTEHLERDDPYFPLLLGVRAEKESPAAEAPGILVHRPRAVVVVYHRVANVARDRWRLAIPPDRFEEQIRSLAERHTLLRLPELAEALRARDLPDGAVVVTFDDGYRDLLTEGLPILRKYGVPATLFVTTGGLDEGEPFWWDVLEAAGLESTELDALQARLMTLGSDERRVELSRFDAKGRDLPARLSVDELVALARAPLIDLGAHGVSHRIFRGLAPSEQRREIHDCVTRLRALATGPISSFAYPIGYPSAEAPAIARSAGLSAVCRIAHTSVFDATHPLSIPRFPLEAWSAEELELRLAALRP